MRRIKIYNDITVRWTITTNGAAESLEGRNLSIILRNYISKCIINEYSVSGNTITFVYPATAQRATGIDIKNRKVTITSDNVQVQNNSGETTLLLNAEGKIQAKLIEAGKVTADQIAQPFEEYADKNAFFAGKSLSWVFRSGAIAPNSYIYFSELSNGAVVNLYNPTTSNISFYTNVTADPSTVAQYGDGNNLVSIVIPPGALLRAINILRSISNFDLQSALYLLVPYTRSGNIVTIKSFKQ